MNTAEQADSFGIDIRAGYGQLGIEKPKDRRFKKTRDDSDFADEEEVVIN